ncbi:leucyl aminopeptidase [Actinokineospora sp. PR83]|uniref:leucyl aminopeptidase n=1 Tax=Actinokineospora sp. PR83 TaxID=2884908 RepID=UPI001F3722BD|nr:leucyl aminopeptidase [Actinokineospora sp. PR83]MCG8920436.1 leucyl aminopeptidase [Actinokineospora sp. PR83]
MSIEWDLVRRPPATAAAAVVGVFAGEGADAVTPEFLRAAGFDASVGQVLPIPGLGRTEVLVGLGPRARVDGAVLRRAMAAVARAVTVPSLAVTVPEEVPAPVAVRAVVEGLLLGGYRFTRYRSDAVEPVLARVDIVVADGRETRAALAVAQVLGSAVLLARDLVNEPGEDLTPEVFADRARSMAAETGVRCEVWDVERMTEEGLGGLLGVGRGSPRQPRLVRLTHEPESPRATVALVGKGVTFDAGGLSLKPTAQMVDMKADMAGAAVVLAAVSALAVLDCPLRVDAWLPLAENMPVADPIRIGDVLTLRGGRTVEVRNADAEGRLIMADALVLAGEREPDAIVDIATLTDAAAVALGREVAAVMGNSPVWTDAVRRAGARAGEGIWPLPLPDSYRAQLVSPIADLVNYTTGVRHGTALLAGLFLAEFVPPGIPWAHLDIQGTAVADADSGEWVRGGTGFGVRTLVELLMAPLPDFRA